MSLRPEGLVRLSWIEDYHGLVLDHTTDHLTVGAPADGCGHIFQASEGAHGFIAFILIDIPHLNRLINTVRSEQIFRRLVPLDTDTFAGMRLNFKIAIRSILTASESLEVVKDPELGLTVIGARSQKTILEGRPLHIKDISAVALQQGSVRLEGEWLIGIKHGNRRGCFPVYRNHLTIG